MVHEFQPSSKHSMTNRFIRAAFVVAVPALCAQALVGAQDRLKAMPGYEQYQKMSREIPTAVKTGALDALWRDARTLEYSRDGKRYRFDLGSRSVTTLPAAIDAPGTVQGSRVGPERGRQFDAAESPDGKLKAFYRGRNVWFSEMAGRNETQVTTAGSEGDRIKSGTA